MTARQGPCFRWFAWHPAWTEDRGWRWLRPVWRHREFPTVDVWGAKPYWVQHVERWDDVDR